MRKFLASESGTFFRKATGSAITNGLALAIGMIGMVLQTRVLGAEGRGLVAWVSSLSLVAMGILQFGLGQANRLFVAGDSSRAGDMAIANILLSVVGAIFILPLFIIYGLSLEIGRNNILILLIGSLTAPIMAISTNLGELLLGLHRTKAFNIYLLTQRLANTFLIIMLVIAGLASPLMSVIALLVSNFIQMSVAIFSIQTQIKTRLHKIKETLGQIKLYLLANYISNILILFSASIIPIILANKHSLKSAGLFAACMVLVDAARSSIRMVGMHALPILASEKDSSKRRKIIKHSILLSLFFGACAAMIFYFTASWVLALLFGTEFSEGIPAMKIISIGLLPSVLFEALKSVIASISNGIYILIPSLVLAVTTAICSTIFVPSYGAIGGAIAFILAFICADIIAGIFLFIKFPQLQT